jgi:hypothetical protein
MYIKKIHVHQPEIWNSPWNSSISYFHGQTKAEECLQQVDTTWFDYWKQATSRNSCKEHQISPAVHVKRILWLVYHQGWDVDVFWSSLQIISLLHQNVKLKHLQCHLYARCSDQTDGKLIIGPGLSIAAPAFFNARNTQNLINFARWEPP